MERINTNRRLGRGLATLAMAAASLAFVGWAGLKGLEKLERFEEGGKTRVCLSGENDTIPPTSADMDCGRVVINDGYGNRKLVVPPQEAPSENDCEYPFTLEDDGRCHFYSPEYFEDLDREN